MGSAMEEESALGVQILLTEGQTGWDASAFGWGQRRRGCAVGETVRRAGRPWTPSVHALLAHLADEGFGSRSAGSSHPWNTTADLTELRTLTLTTSLSRLAGT